MKNLHAKLKNHGKKVIIHLKRHHRKYLFGALCSGILALVGLHTASTINSTFADEEPVNPSITYDSNANITYIDTEGREFTGIGTITISNGEDSITILDRNLGATTNDINDTGSYGYHFQWGNNYGFEIGCREGGCSDEVTQSVTSGETVDTSGYGPGNYYTGNIFRKTNSPRDWSDPQNDNLWGGSGDGEINDRGYFAENQIDRQGPCPDGYHIPSAGEWGRLLNLWVINYDAELSGNSGILPHYSGNNIGLMFSDTLKIPLAGSRGNAGKVGAPDDAILGSSSPIDRYTVVLNIHPNVVYVRKYLARGIAGSLRCFKNQTTVGSTTCDIEYSTTGLTNQDVVAYLTGCSEEITTEAAEYTFTGNGTFIFEFEDLDGNTGEAIATVDRIDKVAPTCSVAYSTTGPTNQNVTATLSCEEDEGIVVTNNDRSMEYTFENTGTFTFEFQDLAGNTGSTDAIVTGIDKTKPTCNVIYNTTGVTTGNVVASLTGCNKTMRGTDLQHTFTGNGTYTFEFQDFAGNTGSADAVVTWINKTKPTCDVIYSTTGTTTGNVVASLTGCSETITGTDTQHTFTENGTYTFRFQNLLGNTGSANATVTGIDKVKPTCDIIYSTTGATTGNVVATLTGCSEAITGTDLQHTFTGNGTYTFNFQDLAGNTGSTEAAVTWIGEYTGVYEIKSGQQMINLYNQGKAITCNVIYSGDNGHQTNTMYIKSGVINENLMIITGNTRTMLYSLEKDGYIYSWGDMYLDGIGFYIPYELDVYEELKGVDNNIKSGAIITCTTGVEEDSVFDLPDGVDFFNIDTYYIDSGVYFIIDAKETAKTGENIDFTITVMKDGKRFKNFLGYVLIDVIDEDGDLLDKNTYEAPGYGYYYFASSDKGKKTFSNGLKINKTGDYYIRVNSLQEGEGFFPISIKGKNDPTLTGNYFKITVNSKAKPGEYTTFTVRAMKDGVSYSNYTGTVIFTLSNKDGGLINKRNYTFSNSGRYTFEASDLGRKIFYSGLKINETGTYILEVNGLNDNFKGSTTINVGKSHGSAEFKYDTLKFNPKYSDEMNEAYQYARYYDITTKDSIKDADMYSGLNRIAMAKMLTNYAENVLGKDNFNTGRNCSFSDVSNSLDKDYDYGVTKACQLGIMGVNMPNNKFYPNGGVTRAEFATALSRLLYGTKDGTEKYYSTHITKLRREGIITNTDPALWELRGYVMLMLKRVAENNDE